MGYPSYVKMIGMTESKRLLLRKTLSLAAVSSTTGAYGTNGNNGTSSNTPATNAFQIVLNPLECPNINKVFTNTSFNVSYRVTDQNGKPTSEIKNELRAFKYLFKYDYLRIKSIFISIKPAQNVSANSGGANLGTLYPTEGDSPISNVYAYFTYRYPMLAPDDIQTTIEDMYGTNPKIDRIIKEGQLKNTYSWPSNKSMTISINKLMYRVNSDPYRIYPNAPFDIQFLGSLCNKNIGIYDPFQFKEKDDYAVFQNRMGENESVSSESDDDDDNDHNDFTAYYPDPKLHHDISVPDLQQADYNIFFGRLVIVSPKQLRFTAEICYDCVLFR